jgi:hypothetical protein
MTFLKTSAFEISAGLALVACAAGSAAWFLLRHRPTADEMERARRQYLAESGRLVDGMLLDMLDMESDDRGMRTMLIFSYRIAGVEYQCSQDITGILSAQDATQVNVGLPCSVRYQPGKPQDSIVIAEEWCGLRAGLPELPIFAALAASKAGRRQTRRN